MGCYVFTKAMTKKKFTNLNLKEIRHEAEKELEHLFSSLSNTQWWLFFCLFEIETWKPVYPMMLKCNVCIAQCLLVGYYKSSDQSNKVDQFSTTEKCLCNLFIDYFEFLLIDCVLVIIYLIDPYHWYLMALLYSRPATFFFVLNEDGGDTFPNSFCLWWVKRSLLHSSWWCVHNVILFKGH